MSSLFLFALLGSALASEAPALDAAPQPVERTQALYGHPTVTVITALSALSGNTPLIVPVTYEREMGDGKSWTLQPMLAVGTYNPMDTVRHKTDNGYDVAPNQSVFAVGILGTQRNYFNGKVSKGWYWAPALKLAFTHVSQPFKQGKEGYWSSIDVNALSIGGLGYVGWRGKWRAFTMYVDGGLGGQYSKNIGTGTQDYTASGLAYDLNIGMGKAF